MFSKYPTGQHALYENLQLLLRSDMNEVVVKGVETRELLHRQFIISYPQNRIMLLHNRNDNIFAKIAETLWVLAGRNDMEFLSHYLPRAPQWADDGKYWRAGYGPRLRRFGKYKISEHMEYTGMDQLATCIEVLTEDSQSRQAVISLWDPILDWQKSKDIPCNNWLHFLIRDNKLHLAVAVRSNDILWGFSGINLFEWSVLHEAMAYWLDVEIGHISWFASSLHLYQQHYERAKQILSNNGFYDDTVYDYGVPRVEWDTKFYALDNVMNEFFMYESVIRTDAKSGWPGRIQNGSNAFIHTCLNMLTVYNAWKQDDKDDDFVFDVLNNIPASDFRVAAVEHIMRHSKYSLDQFNLSVEEQLFLSDFLHVS